MLDLLEGSVDNIACWLRAHAKAQPSKTALARARGSRLASSPKFERKTYAELERTSDAYAFGLRKAGIGRGTRTVVMLAPGPELLEVLFALFKLGAIPVIVDPGMGPRRMLACYETVQAEAFVGSPLAHLVRRAKAHTFRAVEVAVCVGGPSFGDARSLKSLAEEHDEPFPIARMAKGDTLVINFTTGSTGPARGVEYTHEGVVHTVRGLPSLYGDLATTVTFVTLPLFSVFDVLLGVTAVLAPMKPNQPASADPRRMVETMRTFRATAMFASPAFLHRLGVYGEATGATLPDLRLVVAGGAPVMPRILRRCVPMLAPGARVLSVYGATEALPIATIDAAELLGATDALTAHGMGTCAGRPVVGLAMDVVRITDGPIPSHGAAIEAGPGEVGEIVVKGPSVSPRYHGDAASQALTKIASEDGVWHRTGDLGWMDGAGRLWFCGRKSQRVATARGELYTVQCEGIFNAHPAVYRTALVGVGAGPTQTPVMCIELAKPLSPEELRVLEGELRSLALEHEPTAALETFLFHPSLPVDIRHNAKIRREELALWAARQLGLGAGDPAASLQRRAAWAKLVPVLGWVFLAAGLVWPFEHPLLRAAWWLDVFASVGLHGAQLVAAIPAGRRTGHSLTYIVLYTFLFGATWWKFLEPRELSGRGSGSDLRLPLSAGGP